MQGQVAATATREEGRRPSPPLAVRSHRQSLAPYILLAPTVFFLAFFVLWPMVQALLLAGQSSAGSFTSSNFHTMTSDFTFWPSVRNTLLLMATIIPVEFTLALSMALILQTGLRGRQFFLYAWTIPLAISDLAAGIAWLSIFTQNGYLNSILVSTGLSKSGFQFLSYQHPISLFFVVVIAEVWRSGSLVMLILLGGLQGIPKEYSEAADVFGASFWQRIWHVTLPTLKPSIRVALILRTITAFQVFAVVIALTGQSLPVLGSQAYYWYSTYQNSNVAAAFAVLILCLSILSSAVYLTVLRTPSAVTGGTR